MTIAEAARIMKAEVDEGLLEALEYTKFNMENGLVVEDRIRIAYHTLMAGFLKLIGTGE